MYLSVIKRDADLIDGRPRWQIARSLFHAAERREVLIVASHLVQAEVMGHGDVRNAPNRSTTSDLVRSWFLADWIEWCDLDQLIARKVGELSRAYQLRGADATHLATAIRMNAAYLLSNDNGFKHCYGKQIGTLSVMKPQVLWQETLEDSAP